MGILTQYNSDIGGIDDSLLSLISKIGNTPLTTTSQDLSSAINELNTNKAGISDAIKNITRDGTTFTATRANNTTFTFNQQDNNTTYSAGTAMSLNGTTFNHSDYGSAGTAGTSSATSGSTLAVPYVTTNAQGHVTSKGTHTHTVTGFSKFLDSGAGTVMSAISPTADDKSHDFTPTQDCYI